MIEWGPDHLSASPGKSRLISRYATTLAEFRDVPGRWGHADLPMFRRGGVHKAVKILNEQETKPGRWKRSSTRTSVTSGGCQTTGSSRELRLLHNNRSDRWRAS